MIRGLLKMTYDFLFFGVFCLLIIGYLVWDRAHRLPDDFDLTHPMYDFKKKTKEQITGDDE